MKRIRILQISGELLLQMFTAGDHSVGYRVVHNAIPDDAELVGAEFVKESLGRPLKVLELHITSESFPPVEEGEPILHVSPIIRRLA